MQNVILIIHLILALALISVVLLQRSEGGMGAIGGTGMGPQAGRPPLTALAKVTWGVAVAFIITSLTLTIIGARNTGDTSILDRWGGAVDTPAAPAGLPNLPLAPLGSGSPLVPSRSDAPVVPAAPATEAAAPEAATEAPAETPATEAPATEAPATEGQTQSN